MVDGRPVGADRLDKSEINNRQARRERVGPLKPMLPILFVKAACAPGTGCLLEKVLSETARFWFDAHRVSKSEGWPILSCRAFRAAFSVRGKK